MIAAERSGPHGRVIGLDFSAAMLARAASAALARTGISFVQAGAERIPLAAASVDLVLVNGLFNLNPFRDRIFPELARVVKPGGQVYGAELILRETLPDELKSGSANWFS